MEVFVQDENGEVYLSVGSYGPRISPEEREKIFWCFFRGENAKLEAEEGAGYGLYLSQLVARQHLGTEIRVAQEDKPDGHRGYWTEFELTFPQRAAILP